MDIYKSYNDLRVWKNLNILKYSYDISSLNDFHDLILKNIFGLASHLTKKLHGNPPCRFVWFVMGSAGRREQGVISDQDHGIIYENDDEESSQYFHFLGKELADGMEKTGYPYCNGKVMSSNPLWCKSFIEWETQIHTWINEESFETLRYLHIFLDARPMIGEKQLLVDLIERLCKNIYDNPHLLVRLLDNIQHLPKGLGPIGQFITESNGKYSNMLDIKQTIYMPYVNSIRILALKEKVLDSSTLLRINRLLELNRYKNQVEISKQYFGQLLKYRIHYSSDDIYDDTHFVNIKDLDRIEKKELKTMMRDAIKLHEFVEDTIKKR